MNQQLLFTSAFGLEGAEHPDRVIMHTEKASITARMLKNAEAPLQKYTKATSSVHNQTVFFVLFVFVLILFRK